MTVKTLTPEEAFARVERGDAVIVDIREVDEYARNHIAGAQSQPLSVAQNQGIRAEPDQTVIFTCSSGMRTAAHCGNLAESFGGPAFMIDGGLDAWTKAGLPVEIDRKAPLELMRQVQIAAGSLVLLGVLLGWFFAPGFFLLSAFVGAGLTFAGATGFCGMARLLSALPWNRRAAA